MELVSLSQQLTITIIYNERNINQGISWCSLAWGGTPTLMFNNDIQNNMFLDQTFLILELYIPHSFKILQFYMANGSPSHLEKIS